jgi:hypothetical protein
MGCNIYYEHQEGVNEVKAEANEVPEVYRAGLRDLQVVPIARKEVV